LPCSHPWKLLASENWDFEEENEDVKRACASGPRRIGTSSTDLTNWTITKGEVELVGSGYIPAAHGGYCVNLNGKDQGEIKQVRKIKTYKFVHVRRGDFE
jgi:hypothetical protein